MLKQVTALKLPLTTCTIYNPRFDLSQQQTMCETGLAVLNDVIITESTKVWEQRRIDHEMDHFYAFSPSLVFLWLIWRRSSMIRKTMPIRSNPMFKVEQRLSKTSFMSSIIIDSTRRSVRFTLNRIAENEQKMDFLFGWNLFLSIE